MKSATKHKETIVKTVHFDNCHSKHTSDFFDMEDDRPTDVNFWIPDLQLTESDKDILLKSDGWLKSTHMEAIIKIAQKQFPAMNGLQLTEKVPLLSEDIWTTHSPFNYVDAFPSCQIHHNGKDHWVTSLKESDEKVYVFDSANMKLG